MKREKTAVVGMACRFPAANNIDQFWNNLQQGRNCITEIPNSRWEMPLFFDAKIPAASDNTSYAKWGGIIDDFDCFDANFFNISAREARAMDPQQRLLLQETWHCIEHAGIPVQELQQHNTSVFIGAMSVDYQPYLSNLDHPVASHSALGGYIGLLSNRISWCFDFKGESLSIDTACSSSLVALHKATQSIEAGESDYAIVAGVNIHCHPWKHLSFTKLSMLSPQGRCATFDIAADGYVPGEGIGVILLASESRRAAMGAACYGYIAGSAVNHNGNNRSITVPDLTAQTALLTQSLKKSSYDIDDISYIEAHGSGTPLGDPIETEALSQVFAGKKEKCFIGSLKTHIGHLEAAAGIAGVIKVLLMMSHQTLIKTRNLTQENPLIAFERTPLTPVLENCRWEGNKVAAVSSFGFGGSNANAIISKTAPTEPLDKITPAAPLPLLISARSHNSFRQRLQQLREAVSNPELSCYDICCSSLNNHTTPLRSWFLAQNRQQLLHKIKTFDADAFINKLSPADGMRICLLTEQQFARYSSQLPGINTLYLQWINLWPDSKSRQVLQTVAFYQSLCSAGIAVNTLICDEDSFTATCIIAGLLPISSLTDREPGKVNVSHYTIVKGNKVICPLFPEQIQCALTALSVDAQKALSLIAESRVLLAHHPAFHQAFFSWHTVLAAQSINLNSLLENPLSYPAAQQSVLLLIILVSLAALNKKWQLNDKHTDLPDILRLIAALVDQKKLSPQKAAALFTDRVTNNQIEEVAYLTASATHCASVKEIVINILAANPPAKYFQTSVQDFHMQNIQVCDVTTGNIVERLCEIWQSGTDIAWRKLIPSLLFSAQARPLYPFDTKRYWITETAKEPAMDNGSIAIIGFSGRFPGAADAEQLWENLANGICSVTEVPVSRWDTSKYWHPDPRAANKSYSKWGGVLSDIDRFDASFFNILPSEAALMDPQHRLVLEEGWKTLEMAGYTGERLKSAVCGLYVGCMTNDYYEKQLTDAQREISAAEYIGNSHSILSARLAYYLDLKGPTLTLDTACSSSLVCTHLACDALRSGDADIMLAGGATLWLTETPYISMSKASMLSPVGLCKTFDDSADGFVPGESVCFVLLKRLPDALRDKDSIYGVIKGSGINQDGKSNGISAPNLDSQHRLIEQVYRRHHISPASIQYVETHGTGTKLGDPVEVSALTRAFSGAGRPANTCALGALKSNLGHTAAASGVAGMIKILLSLREKTLVPNVNFHKPNAFIDFSRSPFYVLTRKQPWLTSTGPRRAALSSFGFSGTNAHMVIEEAPDIPRSPIIVSRKFPFPVSARNANLLRQYIQQLNRWLENNPDSRLQDISFTLSMGRGFFKERTLVWANSLSDLRQQLQGAMNQSIPPAEFKPLHEQFMQQHAISWREIFQDVDCRIIALPGQVFEYARYWIAPRDTTPSTTLLLSASHPLFSEHKVNGTSLLPATAILSFICWNQQFPFKLGGIKWVKPLTAQQQQLQLEEATSGRVVVKIAPATLCFSAIRKPVEQAEAPATITVPPEHLWSDVDKSQLYHLFDERGLGYTGAFQRIDKRCSYDDAIYTSVTAPDGCIDKLHRDASYLDGVLQIVLLYNEGKGETRVPHSVESWVCYGPLPDKVIVRARQRDGAVDVAIADTQGRVCQLYSGIRLEKIANNSAVIQQKDNVTLFIPQITTGPAPEKSDDVKTLYLDTPVLPQSLPNQKNIDRIVISLTDDKTRTFSEKLKRYVFETFALLKTLVTTPRQRPLSLEYHLLSNSPMDATLVLPLDVCLKIANLESPYIQAKVMSSQRTSYQKPLPDKLRQNVVIKKGATWLITGGSGAVGFALACELAGKYQANILLCGRSPHAAKHSRQIETLHALGGRASYHCMDCTDYSATSLVINSLSSPLYGVIHCAGLPASGLLKNKSADDLRKIISPKVTGTLNLDLVTQNQPLEFFVLTSSISSLLPIRGLTDYSYGNAFLNHFAQHRDAQVISGQRNGKTLSLCWPHWDVGGMPLLPDEKAWLWQRYGLLSLSETEGRQAFIKALLTIKQSHGIVAKGDFNKILTTLNN